MSKEKDTLSTEQAEAAVAAKFDGLTNRTKYYILSKFARHFHLKERGTVNFNSNQVFHGHEEEAKKILGEVIGIMKQNPETADLIKAMEDLTVNRQRG